MMNHVSKLLLFVMVFALSSPAWAHHRDRSRESAEHHGKETCRDALELLNTRLKESNLLLEQLLRNITNSAKVLDAMSDAQTELKNENTPPNQVSIDNLKKFSETQKSLAVGLEEQTMKLESVDDAILGKIRKLCARRL